MKDIRIEVYQHDWIPGFAAFHDDGLIKEEAKAHVVLNIGASLLSVARGEIDKKDLPYIVAEDLMHEVMHVLEAWAEVEFSEDKVDALIENYKENSKGKE